MSAIDFIQFGERLVGQASPDYTDTLNRALQTVVTLSGADSSAFVGFALRPVVAPTVGQFYRATDTVVGASWQTMTTAMISDLTSASTGITKVGTVNTGVWQASSIATTYTDAKIKTVTGTLNRVTVGGTATDPTFDIAATYVGQASIVTVGTIATGVWNGTSIGTGFTDAKVVSITGTASRVSVAGTATVPVLDIDAAYVGQTSIVTLGTVTTGTWQGTSIATGFTDAKIKTVTGTVGTITISGTATDPIFTISAAYIGQSTITTLGTVTTGVWNGTAIATANTVAQVIDLTGTTGRITIGGTATHPTVDVSAAYVGQATITTLGTITAGVWTGTSIGTGFTDAKVKTVTGTANRLTIGGTSTDPTFDISAAYVGQATITTLGTIGTGTWAATAITVDKGGTNLTSFTIGDMVYASGATTLSKLAIGTAAQILVTNGATTAPAWHTLVTADITDLTTATTGITKVGTVTTGTWNAGIIAGTVGGTGVNNGASTITLGGSFATSGAFATTLTVTAATNVTLPTTGTLVNSAVTSLASLTSVGGAFAISGAFTGATTGAFSSTLSTSQLTITDTASRIIPGATSLSLRNNANNADNVLVSDAGAVTIRAGVVATTASFSGALTYGGVTLSNAVTGTGNMVLSASPTFTGTITAAAITGSGIATFGNVIATATSVAGTAGATRLVLTANQINSFGADASTAGALTILGRSSDASINTTLLTIGNTGAVTFAGALSGITTLAGTGAVSGFTTAAFSSYGSFGGSGAPAAGVKLITTGVDGATSAIVAEFYSGTSGRGSFLHLSDGVTYNSAFGTEGAGNFAWYTGRQAGSAGTLLATLATTGALALTGAVSGITTLAGTGAISGFTTAGFSDEVTITKHSTTVRTTPLFSLRGTTSGDAMSMTFSDGINSNGWLGYKDSATAANRYFYLSADDGVSDQFKFSQTGLATFPSIATATLVMSDYLTLGKAYVAGVVAATGTIAIKDNTGTVYNVLVHT